MFTSPQSACHQAKQPATSQLNYLDSTRLSLACGRIVYNTSSHPVDNWLQLALALAQTKQASASSTTDSAHCGAAISALPLPAPQTACTSAPSAPADKTVSPPTKNTKPHCHCQASLALYRLRLYSPKSAAPRGLLALLGSSTKCCDAAGRPTPSFAGPCRSRFLGHKDLADG